MRLNWCQATVHRLAPTSCSRPVAWTVVWAVRLICCLCKSIPHWALCPPPAYRRSPAISGRPRYRSISSLSPPSDTTLVRSASRCLSVFLRLLKFKNWTDLWNSLANSRFISSFRWFASVAHLPIAHDSRSTDSRSTYSRSSDSRWSHRLSVLSDGRLNFLPREPGERTRWTCPRTLLVDLLGKGQHETAHDDPWTDSTAICLRILRQVLRVERQSRSAHPNQSSECTLLAVAQWKALRD